MKKKLLMAISLALVFAVSLISLVQADQVAQVVFTTDVCAGAAVVVISYTDPAGQITTASGLTPWTLDTAPFTAITFFYSTTVTCDGVTYNFQSVSPSGPWSSGAEGTTLTVTGHYVPPVTDTTGPTWTIPSDFSVEATGSAGALVNYTATASDPSGVSSQSCSPAADTMFAMGTTTVTCTATDTLNNTSTGGFNVTVVDTTGPVLTLPSNQLVTAPDASGAIVNFSASANDVVDGPVAVTCSPASASLFPVGTTTVNCSATDSHGNQSIGSFTVTVQYTVDGKKCNGVTGHQILQPINVDGTNVFKQGSTIPIRFRVCPGTGKPGTTSVITSFRLIDVIGSGTVKEFDQAATWDVSHVGQQWVLILRTDNLAVGNTYVYLITLNNGATIQFQFGLR